MRSRGNGDAVLIARRVREFLDEYAPQFLTTSDHTLKAYGDALTLCFAFLQAQGVRPATLERGHLERPWIERWVVWLKDVRGNSPDTCNNRLASLRRFLEYLGSRDVDMRYLHLESRQVKRQKSAKTKVCGMSEEAVEALLATPCWSRVILAANSRTKIASHQPNQNGHHVRIHNLAYTGNACTPAIGGLWIRKNAMACKRL